jgi:membrane-bound metal-dependent hydrolase YbcI (DUF457 family)
MLVNFLTGLSVSLVMTDPYGTPVFTPLSFSVRFLLLTPYFVLCVARFVPFLAIVLSVLSYYQINHCLNVCVRTPFVSDLRQVGGFLRVFRFPPLIKTDLQVRDITEIWERVAVFSTVSQTYVTNQIHMHNLSSNLPQELGSL